MSKALTKKQKDFADQFIETGNQRQSIKDSYDLGSKGGKTDPESLDNLADQMAQETLSKPKVIKYIEGLAPKAVLNIEELADKAKNENVKLNANKDILDRAGYKPKEDQRGSAITILVVSPTLMEKYEITSSSGQNSE